MIDIAIDNIWVSGVIAGHTGHILVWQANNAIRRFCACYSFPGSHINVMRQALITPSLTNQPVLYQNSISYGQHLEKLPIIPNTITASQNDRISTTQAVYGGVEIEEVD